MSPGTRSLVSIALLVAVVITSASSCASTDRQTASADVVVDASVRPVAPGVGTPFGETFGEASDGRPPGPMVEADLAVPVRTADTLGDLAAAVDTRRPASVVIDDLEISAPVTPVGIDGDGAFDLPPGSEAGWYRFGPVPGAAGSSVIAAHVDWNGVPGAFFDLRKASVGTVLSVGYDDDTRLDFVVTSVTQFVKTELPLDELFTREGSPQLVLITCGGDFDRQSRSYTDNVVVVAVPREQRTP